MSTLVHKIVVIDDDPALLTALRIGLTSKGYEVIYAADGERGIQSVIESNPSAVIFDLGLPDTDGLSICKALRTFSAAPIIVLSATSDEDKKIKALDIGADDYITKPFSMGELLARLRVALRHVDIHTNRPENGSPIINLGSHVRIDNIKREVLVDDAPIDLTAKEFDLLCTLASHIGKTFTHRDLLKEVWGADYYVETNYLRVYINRIRKKLGPYGEDIVKTKPGVGYRIDL